MISRFLKWNLVVGLFMPLLGASQTIEDLVKSIELSLAQNKGQVQRAFEAGDLNKQILDFAPIVEQIEEFLKGEEVTEVIGSSFALGEYRNFIENYFLHLTLVHEIESSEDLRNMYPHEMPFKHDGRYPAYPTYRALEKILLFFEVLSFQGAAIEFDFISSRRTVAKSALENLLNSKEMDRDLKRLDKLWSEKSEYKKTAGEKNEQYLVRLEEALHEKEVYEVLVKHSIKALRRKESSDLRGLTDLPMETFVEFQKRIIQKGHNASFPEFKALIEQYHRLLVTSESIEKALLVEPRLQVFWKEVVAGFEFILEEDIYPYRESHEWIVMATEFFDHVERALYPDKANPLHYAKRYAYYEHYMLGLAPHHFTIPSSISLATYSLLKIGGAPLGIGGIASENLWVDSYLQSPNEFRLHDKANHERRRYQFTINYAHRLGIEKENIHEFYLELDRYNRSVLLPLIRRIKNTELKSLDLSQNKEAIRDDFRSLVWGAKYFSLELQLFEEELMEDDLVSSKDIEALVKSYQDKINDKKKIYDMILFEVVHEDALPPSRLAILESIMRPPNLPMPRDFIDFEKKKAVHAMENAGSTMSYIIHKLNGSFYDTPGARLNSIATDEYRTPKKIIETTVELIMHLGSYKDLSREDVLKNVVYLTMTDEGFMSYLLDEFQRDMHPIQRSLINSLKYAESLEMLSLIDAFDAQDPQFSYYLKTLRERIKLSSELSLKSSDDEVKAVERKFLELEDKQFDSFQELQSYYFRVSVELNEKLFSDVNMLDQKLSGYAETTLTRLRIYRNQLLAQRAEHIKQLNSEMNHENLESVKKLLLN